jgi:hypothetical protein
MYIIGKIGKITEKQTQDITLNSSYILLYIYTTYICQQINTYYIPIISVWVKMGYTQKWMVNTDNILFFCTLGSNSFGNVRFGNSKTQLDVAKVGDSIQSHS